MKPWRQVRDELFTPEEQLAHNEEAKRILARVNYVAGSGELGDEARDESGGDLWSRVSTS